MLIPKCCKNCSNRHNGMCCCSLPNYCNEYVEDDGNDDLVYRPMSREEKNQITGHCFICGESVLLDSLYQQAVICDKCRQVIMKLRNSD